MASFRRTHLVCRRHLNTTCVTDIDIYAHIYDHIYKYATAFLGIVGTTVGRMITEKLLGKNIRALPHRPDHYFQFRKNELNKIKSLMVSSQNHRRMLGVDSVVTVYITGQPGMGKTQLARDFARQYYRQQSRFILKRMRRQIFVGTLDASNMQSFQQTYQHIAGLIIPDLRVTPFFDVFGSQDELEESLNIVSDVVKQNMKKRRDWLLVVTNLSLTNGRGGVNTVMERGIPEDWRDKYLPSPGNSSWGKGTVIITTKNRNEVPRLNPFANELHLSGMDKEEAVELLHGLDNNFRKEDLSQMVKIFKGKPLLLASAGDYIVKRRSTDRNYNSGKYLHDLENDKDSLVMKIKQELMSKDSYMKKLFALTCICAPVQIPLPLVAKVLNVGISDALEILSKSMLFNIIPERENITSTALEAASFSVHNRVRQAMITRFQECEKTGSAEEQQEQTDAFQRVINCIITLYQASEDNPEIRAMLHPHFDLVSDSMQLFNFTKKGKAMYLQLGRALMHEGKINKAIQCFEKACTFFKPTEEKNVTDIPEGSAYEEAQDIDQSTNKDLTWNLGAAYSLNRSPKKALHYLEASLKATHVQEDLEYANVLSHYGNALRLNGDLQEAEQVLNRAQKIFEGNLYDMKNYDVQLFLLHLGLLYLSQERLTDSLKTLEQATNFAKELLPHENPHVSFTRAALAKAFYKAGDIENAEVKLRNAIRSYEKTLVRPNHPLFVTMLIDLSTIYTEQGQHKEAMKHLKKAEDLNESADLTLLDVQLCLGNAFLLWKSSDLDNALISANKACKLLQNMEYHDHPYYAKANILRSQIRVAKSQGDDDTRKAVIILQRAHGVFNKKFKQTPTINESTVLQLLADLTPDVNKKKEYLIKSGDILDSIITRELQRSHEELVNLPVLQKWKNNRRDILQKLKLL